MINRIKIDDRCTGCNACIGICPKGAIKLECSSEGFWYPVISEKCIDCGKCKQICPVYGEKQKIGFNQPKVYAAWSNDEENVKRSSSGGIFSCLAKRIIDQEGVVYGAAFVKDWKVEHIRVDDKEDVIRLQGSKYVQSFINPNIFTEIKQDLDSGKHNLNSYIYAPKDDPYHRNKWRDPYPDDKIQELAHLDLFNEEQIKEIHKTDKKKFF